MWFSGSGMRLPPAQRQQAPADVSPARLPGEWAGPTAVLLPGARAAGGRPDHLCCCRFGLLGVVYAWIHYIDYSKL